MGAAGLGWLRRRCQDADTGFVAVLWRRRFADLGLFVLDPPHWTMIRSLLATGLPIGVTVLMEGGLFIAAALLIGRLGEVPAAAHQIAVNVATLCFMVPMGIAEATTVRVGQAMGREDRGGVRRAAYAGYAIVLATQLLSASMLALGNEWVVGFYTTDAALAALAASLLLYAAAFRFPMACRWSRPARCRLKDTRSARCCWRPCVLGHRHAAEAVLGLGLGGFTPAMGPKGMWIGLIAGLSVAAVLLGLRFRRSSDPARLLLRSLQARVTNGA
jgi:MATE family multidrug resistance protein